MNDLISRKQTIIALRAYAGREHGAGHIELANGILKAVCLIEEVAEVPTVEAVPVVHGEWVKDGDFLICLNCESEINIKNSLGAENQKNFCPNCGADMRKKV